MIQMGDFVLTVPLLQSIAMLASAQHAQKTVRKIPAIIQNLAFKSAVSRRLVDGRHSANTLSSKRLAPSPLTIGDKEMSIFDDDDLTAESFGCPVSPIGKAELYRGLARHYRHLAGGCVPEDRQRMLERAAEFEATAKAA